MNKNNTIAIIGCIITKKTATPKSTFPLNSYLTAIEKDYIPLLLKSIKKEPFVKILLSKFSSVSGRNPK
jgi:hypothetical protein